MKRAGSSGIRESGSQLSGLHEAIDGKFLITQKSDMIGYTHHDNRISA